MSSALSDAAVTRVQVETVDSVVRNETAGDGAVRQSSLYNDIVSCEEGHHRCHHCLFICLLSTDVEMSTHFRVRDSSGLTFKQVCSAPYVR